MSPILISRFLAVFSVVVLQACTSENDSSTTSSQAKPSIIYEQKYQKEFEQWKKTQNPQFIAEYEKFFVNKVKQVPTLYELTLNSHPLKAECQQDRFSLPPKRLWANLVEPLQLVEKLQSTGYFAHYKIVSVYRSREANTCVHGAKASKHLSNFAVDFQTLDENKKPYQDHTGIDQQLCQFWHAEGKKHRLGLGLYGKQRYHIDTQGYRTWGVGYKSVSSPCLKSTSSSDNGSSK